MRQANPKTESHGPCNRGGCRSGPRLTVADKLPCVNRSSSHRSRGLGPMDRGDIEVRQPTKYCGRPVFSSIGGQLLGDLAAARGVDGSGSADCLSCGNEANSSGTSLAQRMLRYLSKALSSAEPSWPRVRRNAEI